MTLAVRYPMPAAIAAMALDRHHVVEASAGTGKTFLLEHRVVDLLLRTDATIDQILLVTFTEKATAELRGRLRRLLLTLSQAREDGCPATAPHWLLDEASRARLRAAVAAFDRASIFTIHGFCHRVLTDQSFAAGRPLEQTQVAGEVAARAGTLAALRDTLAVDPGHRPWLAAWLARGSVDDLVALVAACLAQPGELLERFDDAGAAAAIATLVDARARIASTWLDDHARAAFATQTARAVCRRLRALLEHALRDGHPAAVLSRIDGDDRKYWRGRDESSDRELGALIAAAKTLTAIGFRAAVMARFLPVIAARVEREKRRHGQFDFRDMLDLTWAALAAPGGGDLAGELRRRFPFALIDEFQDTDPVQWSIFRALYLDTPGHHLTVIGDPKQAIYSFRGADFRTYLEARTELLARGGGLTELGDNYRSSPALVAAVERLCSAGDGLLAATTPFRPVRAGRDLRALDPAGREAAPVVGLALAPDATFADLARAVAVEIEQLVGDAGLRVGSPGAERAVTTGDVFVLTRTRGESDQVAGALRDHGVACEVYQQEGLLATREAREVCDLLAAIADPRDRSARLRALGGRFFAASWAELPALAELDEGHPWLARLAGWRRLADALDYERLFASILADSQLVERELLLEPSMRSVTNFQHLFEVLREEAHAAPCDVGELGRRLARLGVDAAQSDLDPRNIQRLEGQRGAVQVMTIHRAKGLEAAVVFLCGGFSPGRGGLVRTVRKDGQRRLSIGGGDGGGDHEELDEERRLYYVALTRAIARLYLPVRAATARGARGTYAVVEAQLVASGLAIEERVVTRAVEPTIDAGPLAAPALVPAAAAEPEPAQLGRERRGPFLTSYTRLARAPRPGLRAPGAAESPSPVAAPPAPAPEASALPPGRDTGVVLHHLLEQVELAGVAASPDRSSWSQRPEVDRLFRRILAAHGRPPAELGPALALVWRSLTSPLELAPPLRGLAWVARAAREVDFVFPLGAGFVKGYVDLLFEHGGKTYWLDWKSDVLADYRPAALGRHVAEHYAIQADLYSLAVCRMLGIADAAGFEARFGGLVYLFARGVADGAGVYHARPSLARLRASEATLAAEATP